MLFRNIDSRTAKTVVYLLWLYLAVTAATTYRKKSTFLFLSSSKRRENLGGGGSGGGVKANQIKWTPKKGEGSKSIFNLK